VLFDKIASVYFIFKSIYLYFSVGNGQPRKSALCQLYRRTFTVFQNSSALLLSAGSLLKKQSADGKYTMSERHSSVLCAALSVSVICNMYLVCAALKLVILTFKIHSYSSRFGQKLYTVQLSVPSRQRQVEIYAVPDVRVQRLTEPESPTAKLQVSKTVASHSHLPELPTRLRNCLPHHFRFRSIYAQLTGLPVYLDLILTFKIFTFVDDFVYGAAVVFFRYLNVYSNFLLVVKSCLHFAIVMIYNVRVRHLVVTTLVRWFGRIRQLAPACTSWS